MASMGDEIVVNGKPIKVANKPFGNVNNVKVEFKQNENHFWRSLILSVILFGIILLLFVTNVISIHTTILIFTLCGFIVSIKKKRLLSR